MNWNYRKPIFTNITPLTAIDSTLHTVTLEWAYPTDLTDPNTHNSDTVLFYDLYRHIENKLSLSANGGINNNPESNDFQPNFKFFTSVAGNSATYPDTLSDLSMHYDEGIRDVNGKWLDLEGRDVIEEIRTTKRRLYYKIVANTSNATFNSTPFIYIAHTNGVECRSVVTQVYNNALYHEGDVVWFNGDLGNINRISVDVVYDATANRKRNVWASGNNVIYCLNGETGTIVHSISVGGVGQIMALKIDPDTGDAIFVGNSTNVSRVSVLTGLVTLLNTIPATVNNVGLTISKEAGLHYAYVISNYDTVTKIGLDTTSKVIYPRTQFGCSSSTLANIPNILGITNGSDQGVWVNGHVPIHYQYQYQATSCTSDSYWIDVCPNGTIDPSYANWWNDNHELQIDLGLLSPARCESRHYVTNTTCQTVNINQDTHFLQDIGYIYGLTTSVNNSATNGQLYPYPLSSTASITYSPFTSKTGRTGWVGTSKTGEESVYGRPYTGQPASPDGKDSPNPARSQKGLASNFPTYGSLSGTTYDIYQVNETENKVHKLHWMGTSFNNVSGLTYNSLTPVASSDYWSVTNPTHVSVDSQNNVWVIQEYNSLVMNPNELTLIYTLCSTNGFASGGNCVYPTMLAQNDFVTQNYVYGRNGNNPYIEYYLTRATTFNNTITSHYTNGQYLSTYGVTLTGTNTDKITNAKNWVLNGSNYLTSGIRVYPNYVDTNKTATFSRVISTDTMEYNSDNLGTLMLFNTQEVESDPDFIHPSVTYPQISLNIVNPVCVSINCDGTFWQDQVKQDVLFTEASGYDDLKVTLSATLITSGSFVTNDYTFVYDDKIQDIGGHVNKIDTTTQNNYIAYTYNDPSINGKPSNRTVQPDVTTGKYTSHGLINFEPDCYLLIGDTVVGSVSSNTVDATVFERWPTARFYVTPIDTAEIRNTALSSWNLGSASAFPVGDNRLSRYDENRVVYGYDPLSAQFTDTSITRTWQMSSWYWTFGDLPTYLGFTLPQLTTYLHVTSTIVSGTPASSTRDDCTSERRNMVEHLYKGAGIYYATLWVQASNTGTTSWNISSGVTDETSMLTNFVSVATRQINVLEVCPGFGGLEHSDATFFNTISAKTVVPTFSADSNVVDHETNAYVSNTILSGYAPYLQVTFESSVSARSRPISAITWNFGDYYTNPLPSDVTRYAPPTVGWPIWNTDGYYTSAIHTYVMPGFYDVSLQFTMSAVQGLSSTCENPIQGNTRNIYEQNMYVYVQEILPTCNLNVIVPSLSSPVTVTATTSATETGSFPICRIDYDFGDGSDRVTISRIMSADYVNHTNISAFSDLSDPRNITVDHTYNRTTNYQSDTYTISAFVYACNTNSYDVDTIDIGPITVPTFNDIVGDVHLIENRMYNANDDLLLVFEGDKSLNNYTILLSTGNI
jgi:hypothetical protein